MGKRADKDFRKKILHDQEHFQDKVLKKDSKLVLEKNIPKNNNPKAEGSPNQKISAKDIGKERQKRAEYKRRNFTENLYTRNTEATSGEKLPPKEDSKTVEEVKEKLTKTGKKQVSKKPKKVIKKRSLSYLGGFSKGTEAVRDYLSQGSEDNQGVEAGEKTADFSAKLIRGTKRYAEKKRDRKAFRLEKYNRKTKGRNSKLIFEESEGLRKASDDSQRINAYKRFQKKRQMKESIQSKYKMRLRDRLKEGLLGAIKSSKEVMIRNAKGFMLIFLSLIILGTFLMNFSVMSLSGMMNSSSGVLSTSYLSDPNVLMEVNQQFESMEEGLQDEMNSVQKNHPGYDEYIIQKDKEIGHNVHELLSYVTSRYGEVKKARDVEDILKDLFQRIYSLSYREKIEIRYKTVKETYVDREGKIRSRSRLVPYEYKKLFISLKKKEMDTVIREIFEKHPNNVSHYESLLSAKGNMESFFGSGNANTSELILNPDFENPGKESVKALFSEAEKHIGKKYVFGANGPNNFDCSSFVCWSFTHSGVKNMPRTTAYDIYKSYCKPISKSEAKAGDIIFFKNTYKSGTPISHVGIYAGDGMMIHAGNPIRFVSINTPYWKEHFYGFGRVR